jgi:pilus assembly protein Flp/PilA
MESNQRALRSSENHLKRDRGASLVEYALLLALIAVVCIGALTFLGTATGANFDDSADSIIVAN